MNILPLYDCHKQVRAAQITDVHVGDQAIFLELKGMPNHQVVNKEWMGKHSVHIGGYFVEYSDGYTSYSPKKAFEEGYTLAECGNIQETPEGKEQ